MRNEELGIRNFLGCFALPRSARNGVLAMTVLLREAGVKEEGL